MDPLKLPTKRIYAHFVIASLIKIMPSDGAWWRRTAVSMCCAECLLLSGGCAERWERR